MDERIHVVRNGLICALLVAGATLMTYPVAEIGISDDWSYAKTALAFAQTGHFVYNGWSSPILGWQVIWGVLFIKLMGFSFTAVRLSTLPVAMAAIALFYAILARFGVNERNAMLGTLTLGLSPLFIPMAASYMTDVPGLFCILLCLYLCQRAVAAGTSKQTIIWLSLAAASNVVGGTVRQIVWLGALVMVPSAGWLLRKRRGVLPAAALLWVGSAAGATLLLRWFVQQPNSLVLEGADDPGHPVLHLAFQLLGALLCLLLVLYPVLVAWLPEIRRLDRATLMRIAALSLMFGLFQWELKWLMPWLTDVISTQFAPQTTGQVFGARPVVYYFPMSARLVISLLVIVTALVLIEYLRSRVRGQTENRMENRAEQMAARDEVFWLLGPFAMGYVLLLMLAGYRLSIADRYLLGLIPLAIIVLLRLYQRWIAASLPATSVVVLVIYALLAIGGTHDLFASYRARAAAIGELRAAGISRTEIQGGIEYDGWTQVAERGYIAGGSLIAMDRAYRSAHPPTIDDCGLSYAPLTPAVTPTYSVVFRKRMWCLAPSQFPAVDYRTWLPPFRRTIYVQRLPQSGR